MDIFGRGRILFHSDQDCISIYRIYLQGGRERGRIENIIQPSHFRQIYKTNHFCLWLAGLIVFSISCEQTNKQTNKEGGWSEQLGWDCSSPISKGKFPLNAGAMLQSRCLHNVAIRCIAPSSKFLLPSTNYSDYPPANPIVIFHFNSPSAI